MRGLNSRFVRLMRDAAQDGGTGGGGGAPANQGQGDQGQGGSNQGGTGGQGGGAGQLDNLFDDVDDNDNANQGGQGGTNQGAGDGFNQAQMAQLSTAIESAVDRRVNHLVNGRRRRATPPANQNDNQNQQQNNQQLAAQVLPAVDAGAQREARIAFREYVGDEMGGRFISAQERQAAMAFGQLRVSAWDGDGDPDEFGRATAREVAGTVKGLRDHYRELTLRQLRKRGLLLENGQQGAANQLVTGGGIPGGGSLAPVKLPTPTKAARAVQDAVALAGEFNVRNGHVPADQTAGVSGA